jgi:hypothetical protein
MRVFQNLKETEQSAEGFQDQLFLHRTAATYVGNNPYVDSRGAEQGQGT